MRERRDQRTDRTSDAKSEREGTMLNLLEEYSERLIGIVDQKMRTSRVPSPARAGREKSTERRLQEQGQGQGQEQGQGTEVEKQEEKEEEDDDDRKDTRF